MLLLFAELSIFDESVGFVRVISSCSQCAPADSDTAEPFDIMENGEKQNGPTDEPEIVIIGAGMAGIAAGNKLSKEGFTNFKIFEASDRIGGRIWSVVTGELPYVYNGRGIMVNKG